MLTPAVKSWFTKTSPILLSSYSSPIVTWHRAIDPGCVTSYNRWVIRWRGVLLRIAERRSLFYSAETVMESMFWWLGAQFVVFGASIGFVEAKLSQSTDPLCWFVTVGIFSLKTVRNYLLSGCIIIFISEVTFNTYKRRYSWPLPK